MAIPKHVAISLDNVSDWCKKKNISINEGCNKYFGLLSKLVNKREKDEKI